jgi:hypothetical protein
MTVSSRRRTVTNLLLKLWREATRPRHRMDQGLVRSARRAVVRNFRGKPSQKAD